MHIFNKKRRKIYLLKGFWIFFALFFMRSPGYSGLTDQRTAWTNFLSNPSNGFVMEYSYNGELIQDLTAGEGDVSKNTTPSGNNDISSLNATKPSTYYGYYDGGTKYNRTTKANWEDDWIFFRLRLDNDPSANNNKWANFHWNILVDVDQDGYKEYWLDLFGSDQMIHVMYNNNNEQSCDIVTDLLEDYNALPEPHISNFTMTNQDGAEYFIDYQLPLSVFKDKFGNQMIYPDTPLAFMFSTGNSVGDPLQKDWMHDPDNLVSGTYLLNPIAFGDVVDLSGAGRINFVTSLGAIVESYYHTDLAYVSILDKTTGGATNLSVRISNQNNGDYEDITAEALNSAYSSFRNSTGLSMSTSTSSPNDGTLTVGSGHVVKAYYYDPNDGDDDPDNNNRIASVNIIAPGQSYANFMTTFKIARDNFQIGLENIGVKVVDAAANTDPSTAQSVTAYVWNTALSSYETVTLNEYQTNTGVFYYFTPGITNVAYTGSVTNDNSILEASDQDTIMVYYTNSTDSLNTATGTGYMYTLEGGAIEFTDLYENKVTSQWLGTNIKVLLDDKSPNVTNSNTMQIMVFNDVNSNYTQDAGEDFENVTIYQKFLGSGQFTNTIGLTNYLAGSFTANNGVLEMTNGRLVALYIDASDGDGFSSNDEKTAVMDVFWYTYGYSTSSNNYATNSIVNNDPFTNDVYITNLITSNLQITFDAVESSNRYTNLVLVDSFWWSTNFLTNNSITSNFLFSGYVYSSNSYVLSTNWLSTNVNANLLTFTNDIYISNRNITNTDYVFDRIELTNRYTNAGIESIAWALTNNFTNTFVTTNFSFVGLLSTSNVYEISTNWISTNQEAFNFLITNDVYITNRYLTNDIFIFDQIEVTNSYTNGAWYDILWGLTNTLTNNVNVALNDYWYGYVYSSNQYVLSTNWHTTNVNVDLYTFTNGIYITNRNITNADYLYAQIELTNRYTNAGIESIAWALTNQYTNSLVSTNFIFAGLVNMSNVYTMATNNLGSSTNSLSYFTTNDVYITNNYVTNIYTYFEQVEQTNSYTNGAWYNTLWALTNNWTNLTAHSTNLLFSGYVYSSNQYVLSTNWHSTNINVDILTFTNDIYITNRNITNADYLYAQIELTNRYTNAGIESIAWALTNEYTNSFVTTNFMFLGLVNSSNVYISFTNSLSGSTNAFAWLSTNDVYITNNYVTNVYSYFEQVEQTNSYTNGAYYDTLWVMTNTWTNLTATSTNHLFSSYVYSSNTLVILTNWNPTNLVVDLFKTTNATLITNWTISNYTLSFEEVRSSNLYTNAGLESISWVATNHFTNYLSLTNYVFGGSTTVSLSIAFTNHLNYNIERGGTNSTIYLYNSVWNDLTEETNDAAAYQLTIYDSTGSDKTTDFIFSSAVYSNQAWSFDIIAKETAVAGSNYYVGIQKAAGTVTNIAPLELSTNELLLNTGFFTVDPASFNVKYIPLTNGENTNYSELKFKYVVLFDNGVTNTNDLNLTPAVFDEDDNNQVSRFDSISNYYDGTNWNVVMTPGPSFVPTIGYYLTLQNLTNAALVTANSSFDDLGTNGLILLSNVSVPHYTSNVVKQNYPNPFNPNVEPTAFTLELTDPNADIEIKIYTLTGNLVRILTRVEIIDNTYQVLWDGLNDSGLAVASGLYYGVVQVGDVTDVIKVLLVRR